GVRQIGVGYAIGGGAVGHEIEVQKRASRARAREHGLLKPRLSRESIARPAAVHCGAAARRRKLPRRFAGQAMANTIEDALQRLDGAVGQLEFAIARRVESERRRGDLDTELQIMQDDRARLAMELDGALA